MPFTIHHFGTNSKIITFDHLHNDLYYQSHNLHCATLRKIICCMGQKGVAVKRLSL